MTNVDVSKPSKEQENLIKDMEITLKLEDIKTVLETYGYTIKDQYLCHVKYKQGDIEYHKVSNFIAMVTQEVYKDDGSTISLVRYKIDGFNLFTKTAFPIITVTPDSFTSGSWIHNHWGMGAIVEPGIQNKERVKHTIQLLSQKCPRQILFTHLGWRKLNSKWVYLHSGGAIGYENVDVVLESDDLKNYLLNELSVNVDESLKYSLNFLSLADESATYPLFSLISLAPLCEMFNQSGIIPKFTLWLVGSTGTRKSSIASCMLNFFGKFHFGDEFPASFRDTYNNIEKKAYIVKDSLLVVDDFHPPSTKDDRKRMEQVAQNLLRGYGDRSGKGRMGVDTSLLKTYTPRGLCLVTGEDLPTAGISTAARYLSVNMKGINLNRLTEFQENSHFASQSMITYIKWLSQNFDQTVKKIHELFRKYRSEFSNQNLDGRHLDATVWLYIGLSTYLEFLYKNNILKDDKYQSIKETGKYILLQTGQNNKKESYHFDPIKQFISALETLINTKMVTILYKNLEPTEQTHNFIGWEDENYYYLKMDPTLASVINYYSKLNQAFATTKNVLIKMLTDKGYIYGEGVKGSTSRAILGNKQRRTVRFNKSSINDYEDE